MIISACLLLVFQEPPLLQAFRGIEQRTGGRLGVFALDTGSGQTFAYQENDRFPMCSTFKLPLAAAVLKRVENGREQLGRRIRYSKADLIGHSPVTTSLVAEGSMSVQALAQAAVEVSDNAAANLLLASVGGPAGFNHFIRSLGDKTTRLDRFEPAMSESAQGDPRDTTTPAAFLRVVKTTLLGEALRRQSRELLRRWMMNCRTGLTCLRAGIPTDWTVADKTGTGDHGTRNDVAIIWRSGRKPVMIAAFLTQSTRSSSECDAALAAVGRVAIAEFTARK